MCVCFVAAVVCRSCQRNW